MVQAVPTQPQEPYYHKGNTIGNKQMFMLVMKNIHLKLIEKDILQMNIKIPFLKNLPPQQLSVTGVNLSIWTL